MRRIEQTVTCICVAAAGKLGVRKAKCNKMNLGVIGECLVETASGNALGLNDSGDYHDADSSMKLADVLHEFNNRFASVDYRID